MCNFLQTYTRRKAAKERAKQTEGVQLRPSVQDDRKGRETTQMALPQFQREKKSYTPCKYLHATLPLSQILYRVQVLFTLSVINVFAILE